MEYSAYNEPERRRACVYSELVQSESDEAYCNGALWKMAGCLSSSFKSWGLELPGSMK